MRELRTALVEVSRIRPGDMIAITGNALVRDQVTEVRWVKVPTIKDGGKIKTVNKIKIVAGRNSVLAWPSARIMKVYPPVLAK